MAPLKKQRISIPFDPDVKADLAELAKRDDRSFTAIVELALRLAIPVMQKRIDAADGVAPVSGGRRKGRL